jgi:cytochrome P450
VTTAQGSQAELADWVSGYLADPTTPDPYPMLARLQEIDPVHYSQLGVWVFTRYADVDTIQRDRRWSRFEAAKGELAIIDAEGDADLARAVDAQLMMLINRDEPDHARIRNLLRKAFSPRSVESWTPRITEVVRTIFDGIADKPDFDFLSEVGYPVPEIVICELMGVPHSDHALWGEWAAASVGRFRSTSIESESRANAAMVDFYDYFKELVRDRRRNLGDDLVSVLAQAEESGDRLTESELIGTLIMLITAGHETTANMAGNGLYCLLGHPDQFRLLTQRPDLVPNAIEEMLRFEPTTRVGLPRIALEPLTFGDVTVPAGARAISMRNAANRDPAVFVQPDVFNVTRRDIRHLSFGAGIHFCLGAMLARVELAAVFDVVVREFGSMEMVDVPSWRNAGVHCLDSLRVAPGPRRNAGSDS